MNKVPFEIITGTGLGTSNSSLKQIGSLWPAEPLGLMGIKINCNITNGNIVIEDRPVVSLEYKVPQEIKFTYNSQADSAQNAWQLAIKKIKKFPTSNDNTAIISAEDGNQSTYTSKPGTNSYFAPDFTSGTPYLTFDTVKNRWVMFYQATQSQEIYDADGNLLQRIDKAGRVTAFEYKDGTLSAVTGPSGDRYEIRRDGHLYAVFLGTGSSGIKLQSYSFDDSGLTTSLPDGNQVKYLYTKIGSAYDYQRIAAITQSDGSTLNLEHTKVNNQYFPSAIRASGTGVSSTFRLNYSNPSQVVVNISDGSIAKFGIDKQSRITQVDLPSGYFISSPADVLRYFYNERNQLEKILYPDGTSDIYSYDFPEGSLQKTLGLLKSKTLRDGRVISYYYDTNQPLKAPLIAQSIKSSTTATDEAVTRNVYDYDFDAKGQYHIFLRYKISPEGRVTEYRPLPDGSVATQREYTQDRMTVIANLPPNAIVTVSDVEAWKNQSKVNPQAITLAGFQYDKRGQTLVTNKYANVDAAGAGIKDEQMSIDYTTWDKQGGLLVKAFKQFANQEGNIPTSRNNFDLLHRLTQNTDAMMAITSISYNDADRTLTTTLPNGSQKVEKRDTQGLLISSQLIADGITRTTIYERDVNGITRRIINPDNSIDYPLYDLQSRLGFLISTTGSVTQNIYNVQKGFTQTISYENAIDLSVIIPPGETSPVISILQNALATDPKFSQEFCRSSYKFYDANGRLQYEVDAENYVIQYVCDKFDNVNQTIAYADPLSSELLNQLIAGQAINLSVDLTRDRVKQAYYDKDNRLIGLKDAAGYVTERVLDEAGRAIEIIQYAQAKPGLDAINDFTAARPASTPADAHQYKFYNARNLLAFEVNAEGYLIQRVYLPCGIPDKTISYANPVAADWYKNPRVVPTIPAPSTEDRVMQYNYDALNRVTGTLNSNGKVNEKNYDVMGNLVEDFTFDGASSPSADGDKSRRYERIYDGFGQVVAETNPFIAQQIMQIELSNLPPEIKALKIAEIWQTAAIRHVFDGTGLKLINYNTLGKPTYFYYDAERRPALIIGPTGIVKQSFYNATGEVYRTCDYANLIDTSNLQGGLLTPEILRLLAALSDPKKDHIESVTLDHLGKTATKTDANNNTSAYKRNAFGEVTEEVIPLDSQKNIVIARQYDVRGKEVQTTYTGSNLQKIIKREFNNFLAKLSKLINTAGEVSNRLYDKLGNLQKKILLAQNPGESNFTHSYAHDAFNRLASETNSLGLKVQKVYNQAALSCQTIMPISNTGETTVNNIFDEITARIDSQGGVVRILHAPDGQTQTVTDELNRTTENEFNTEGKIEAKVNPDGSATESSFNDALQLTKQSVDATGLTLTTSYEPNAFNSNEMVTDPLGIKTINKFDNLNNLTESIEDPEGLSIKSSHDYNAMGAQTDVVRGDITTPNQYHQATIIDSLNRKVGAVIDPENLKITSRKTLDGNDRVVEARDANNNPTYTFYDALGNKRFVVEASGAVSEWQYNAERQVTLERTYLQFIDINSINASTKIGDLQAKLFTNLLDSRCYHFYDQNGREKYTLDLVLVPEEKTIEATVTEKGYSKANREIRSVRFADFIDANKIDEFTTETLDVLLTTHRNNANNRNTYQCLDAAGQARFTFDANKGVIENRFDLMGNIIASKDYATKVGKPEDIYQLSPDDVAKLIGKDSANDRASFRVWDSANRLRFIVDGEGGVTRLDRNANGWVETECHFAKKITVPQIYNDLVTLLEKLVIDSLTDRVLTRKFDPAGNVEQTIDAAGNINKFEFDALGNQLKFTDAKDKIWFQQFDRACRKTTATAPSKIVSNVLFQNGKLSQGDSQQLAIKTINQLDPAGNVTGIVIAEGTPYERSMASTFSPLNKLVSTTIANVSVDDETKPASLTTRPVKLVDVTTKIIRDARELDIGKLDENGFWSFKVRNSLGQIVFELEPLDVSTADSTKVDYRVKKNKLNAFGDVETVTTLNNVMTFSVNQFTTTGVPYLFVAQNITFDDENDRNIHFERDGKGQVISMRLDASLYAYADQNDNVITNTGTPTVNFTYNAFDEEIYRARLLHANTWSVERNWYDKNGNEIAKYQPSGKVTVTEYNAFNEPTNSRECAGKLPAIPGVNQSFAALIEALSKINDKLDRSRSTIYDLVGNIQKQIQQQVLQYTFSKDKDGLPSLPEAPPIDIPEVIYTFSPTKKKTSATFANGSRKCWYYDECDNLIAESGPIITTYDENKNAVRKVPLVTYGLDAHGKQIIEINYELGTDERLNPNIFPTITPSANDRITFKLLDGKRGLLMCRQDAMGNLRFLTTSANKQAVRAWNILTQWINAQGATAQVIDEYRTERDAQDRKVATSVLRDNTLVETKRWKFDTFDQITQEDPGFGNFDITMRYLRNGKLYFSNANKGAEIVSLGNLTATETVSISSTSQAGDSNPTRLSQVSVSQLAALVDPKTSPVANISLHITKLDNANRSIELIAPSLTQISGADNIPLQVQVIEADTKSILTWPLPQEFNVTASTITLNPVNYSGQTMDLLITKDNEKYTVDISSLPVDMYEYKISYYMAGETEALYTSEGVIQCTRLGNAAGKNVTVTVANDNQLTLSGNIEKVTQAQIIDSENNIVATLSVTNNNIDLSTLPTGRYTIKPLTSDQEELAESVQFTIFTNQAADLICSREMFYSADLTIIDGGNEGILSLSLPEYLSGLTAELTIEFDGTSGEPITETLELEPDDDNQYQVDFKEVVGDVLEVSIRLYYQGEWLTLYKDEPPIPETNQSDKDDFAWVEKPSADVTLKFKPYRQVMILAMANIPPNLTKLEFLDISLDRQAIWSTVPVTTVLTHGLVIDVTNQALGNYPFRNPVTNNQIDIFSNTHGKEVYSGDRDIKRIQIKKPVSRKRDYDNWDNVIREINSFGYTTEKLFNYRNHCIKIEKPETNVMLPDGTVIRARPTRLFSFTIMGFQDAVMNENGNVTTYLMNEVGINYSEILADNTVLNFIAHDIFRNTIFIWDSRQGLTLRRYNLNNLVVFQAPPSWDKQTNARCLLYLYNENNRINAETNGAGETTRTNHDGRNNIIARFMPNGWLTNTAFDPNRQVTLLSTPSGNVVTQRDAFGNSFLVINMSGGVTRQVRDYAQNIRSLSTNDGNLTEMAYINSAKGWINIGGGTQYYTMIFSAHKRPTPNQNLLFVYDQARLSEVHDLAQGTVTYLGYDTEDNLTDIKIVTVDGEILRQQSSRIDEAGREILAFDTTVTVNKQLDAKGNRRTISIDLKDPSIAPVNEFITNLYDQVERMVQQNTSADQLSLQYENNLRVREIFRSVTAYIDYDVDTLLKGKRNASTQLLTLGRDNAGRVTEDTVPDDGGIRTETKYKDGTSYPEHVTVKKRGSTTPSSETQLNGIDSFGYSSSQKTILDNDSNKYTVGENRYIKKDAPQLVSTTGWIHTKDGDGDKSTSINFSDSNNATNGVSYHKSLKNDDNDKVAVIKNTFNGQAYEKVELTTSIDGHLVYQRVITRYMSAISGEPLLSYVIAKKEFERVEHTSIGGMPNTYVGNNGGGSFTSNYSNVLPKMSGKAVNELQDDLYAEEKDYFENAGKLGARALTVDASYPPSMSQTMIVQPGDDYKTIAVRSGNPEAAQAIEAANAGKNFEPGDTVVIPQLIENTNQVNAYPAYNLFMRAIIPALAPHYVPHPHYEHASFWATAAKVFACVVVSLIVPELAGAIVPILAGMGVTLNILLIEAVVTGLLDAGAQGIEIALGLQKDFSIAEMVEDSVSAGLGSPASVVEAVSNAAIENITGQVIGLELGKQTKFDFRQLFVSVVNASVMAESGLGNVDKKFSMTQVLNNNFNAFVSAAISGIVYGKTPRIEDVAAQALGTEFAYSVAESINAQLEPYYQQGMQLLAQQKAQTQSQTQGVWRKDQQTMQQAKPTQQQSSTANIHQKLAKNKATAQATDASLSLDTPLPDVANMSIGLDFDKPATIAAARTTLSNSRNPNLIDKNTQPTVANTSQPTLTHDIKNEIKEGWLESLADRGVSVAEIVAEELAIETAELVELVNFHKNAIYVDTHSEPIDQKIENVLFRNTMQRLENEAEAGVKKAVRLYRAGTTIEVLALSAVVLKGAWEVHNALPGHKLDQFMVEDSKFIGGYLGAEAGLGFSPSVLRFLGVAARSYPGFGIAFGMGLLGGSIAQAIFGRQTEIHNEIMSGPIPPQTNFLSRVSSVSPAYLYGYSNNPSISDDIIPIGNNETIRPRM